MARLITPRPKNVRFVVAIVFPIHGPIGMVMFPDESAGELCLTHSDIAGYEKGPLQVAKLSRCFERGDQGFTAMHVGILAAVREQRFPVAGRLVCVQTAFLRPKALFHEIKSLAEIFLPLNQACTERAGISEKNKRETIAMIGGIFDLGFAFEESQYPRIPAGRWVAMHVAKERQAVYHPLKVLLPVKVLLGHRIGKHKSCTADQVASYGVIDGTG